LITGRYRIHNAEEPLPEVRFADNLARDWDWQACLSSVADCCDQKQKRVRGVK